MSDYDDVIGARRAPDRIIVLGADFHAMSPRMRRLEAEQACDRAGIVAKPSLWRRIVRWLKG